MFKKINFRLPLRLPDTQNIKKKKTKKYVLKCLSCTLDSYV